MVFAYLCKSTICFRGFLIFFSSSFTSYSAGSAALRAFLAIGTALSATLSKIPKFSTGGDPKLSGQVAAPFESS